MAGKRTGGKGKRYSQHDKEQAVALYALHGNYAYVAEQIGAPESTVRGWLQSEDGRASVAECRAKNRAGMDERITSILDQALDVIEQQVQRYAAGEGPRDLREIGTVYGILYDKRALARGEATSNVGQSVVLQDASDADVRALLDKLRADG